MDIGGVSVFISMELQEHGYIHIRVSMGTPIDQQDLRTAQCEQTKTIPHGESLQDLNTKPSRRQGIVTAIVNRGRGDAEVRQTVVGAVEAAGEAVSKDGIWSICRYTKR